MRPAFARVIAALLIAAGAVLAGSASDARAELPVPELEVGFEDEVTAGNMMALAAYLTDPAGNPIAGAEIVFYAETTFMNNTGNAELGRAITNSDGLALLRFEPRIEGERLIIARFAGNEVFAPLQMSETLTVLAGSRLHYEPSPVRVPGANVGMAASVLAAVWAVFVFSLVGLWRIARIGERRSRASNG